MQIFYYLLLRAEVRAPSLRYELPRECGNFTELHQFSAVPGETVSGNQLPTVKETIVEEII